jgi:hypothetical protein
VEEFVNKSEHVFVAQWLRNGQYLPSFSSLTLVRIPVKDEKDEQVLVVAQPLSYKGMFCF